MLQPVKQLDDFPTLNVIAHMRNDQANVALADHLQSGTAVAHNLQFTTTGGSNDFQYSFGDCPIRAHKEYGRNVHDSLRPAVHHRNNERVQLGNSRWLLQSVNLEVFYNATTVSVSQYMLATNDDPATDWVNLPYTVAAGERVILVDSDIDQADIQTIRAYGGASACVLIRTNQTTLIGSGDRLSDTRANLQDGDWTWSHTPPTTPANTTAGKPPAIDWPADTTRARASRSPTRVRAP